MSETRIERLEDRRTEELRSAVAARIAACRSEGYLCLATLWSERPRRLVDRLLGRPALRMVELRFARDGSLPEATE